MFTYPTTVNATNYRLLPAGKFYSTRRNGPVLGIVLHITAGLQDLGMDGTDSSAESVAKWAASGNAQVSWHVGVDSDSVVPCLPSTYTAWHAAGYNSRTFGIEISKLDVDWSDMPAAWVTATLKNAARALAPIVVRYGLPLELRTKAQVDAAIAANKPFGFVYHSSTSAGTRSDPGKNFPFSRLMDYIRAEINGTPTTAAPAPTEDDMPLTPADVETILNHDSIPSPMLAPGNPNVTVRSALSFAMQWSLAGRNAAQAAARDAAVARALAEASALKGEALTADETAAAAERGAQAALDARITGAEVKLEVTP